MGIYGRLIEAYKDEKKLLENGITVVVKEDGRLASDEDYKAEAARAEERVAHLDKEIARLEAKDKASSGE